MITSDHETSQTTPNWNKKLLTTTKSLSENLKLKLLCDVILSSLPEQSNNLCFTMAIVDVEYYH